MSYRFYRHAALLIPFVSLCGCHKELPLAVFPSVRTGVVSSTEAGVEARYSFTLVPNRESNLGFKSGGIVDEIAEIRGADGRMREITMGDPAPAGLRLARVRTIDYQQTLDAAKASLSQATASLASANASQHLNDVNFERASNLYREGSLTKQNYDQSLQQKLASDASVKVAQAAILSAQTGIAQAQLALHDTAVDSPFNGVVVNRQVELGNVITSAATAFQVADIHILKADFTVPDTLLSSVPMGKKIALDLPDALRPVTAIVTAVSSATDPNSHLFTVEISLPNPENHLKPGMIGSLELVQDGNSKRVLTIPLESLVHTKDGSGFAVFVPRKEGGHIVVKTQPIEVGRGIGEDIEVHSGLSLNEEVITTGAQMLYDNEEVRVMK
jgi:RND family efflux transporter MFP subunit